MEGIKVKWYVVRTFSGHENKVKTIIDMELRDNDALRARIHEVLVPTEKVFEVKDGKIVRRNTPLVIRDRTFQFQSQDNSNTAVFRHGALYRLMVDSNVEYRKYL